MVFFNIKFIENSKRLLTSGDRLKVHLRVQCTSVSKRFWPVRK